MMGGFGMGFGWILGIVLVGVIIWAVMNTSGNNVFPQIQEGDKNKDNNALDDARKRYARGELSKNELEEIERTFQSS